MSAQIERGWLSVIKAASYAGLSPVVLRRAIATGELPAYKKPSTYRDGGRSYLLVNKNDIDEWIRSQTPATEVIGNAY